MASILGSWASRVPLGTFGLVVIAKGSVMLMSGAFAASAFMWEMTLPACHEKSLQGCISLASRKRRSWSLQGERRRLTLCYSWDIAAGSEISYRESWMWEFGRWSLGHVENPCARLRLKSFDATKWYKIWIECYTALSLLRVNGLGWRMLQYWLLMDDFHLRSAVDPRMGNSALWILCIVGTFKFSATWAHPFF